MDTSTKLHRTWDPRTTYRHDDKLHLTHSSKHDSLSLTGSPRIQPTNSKGEDGPAEHPIFLKHNAIDFFQHNIPVLDKSLCFVCVCVCVCGILYVCVAFCVSVRVAFCVCVVTSH